MSTSVAPMPTGTQFATAFDGKLEARRVSLLYRIGLLAVAVVMVLLPLAYVGVVTAVAWAVWWHATNDAWWVVGVGSGVTHGVGGYRARGWLLLLTGFAFVAPIVAGLLLVIFLIAPLWPRKFQDRKFYWVDRREQPLLFAFVDRLCDAMRSPRPARINLVADGNAWVHVDNGWLGLVRRRLVLTIGLPMATALDLRQFTGVVAHEMGHFAQGGSMRLSFVVNGINGWLARLAWAPNPIDNTLDAWTHGDSHWTLMLIALLARTGAGVARLVFKGLAIVGHAVTRNLSRQAEFDADRQAARIVGSDAAAAALSGTLYLDAACSLALATAERGWAKRQLPDDLVELAEHFRQALPGDVKAKIEASVLSQEASWFDTHPPLFKRIAALKKARLKGVLKLDAPATCLFREFDELCKFVTIDAYQAILGPKLQAEHLVTVPPPTLAAAAAT